MVFFVGDTWDYRKIHWRTSRTAAFDIGNIIKLVLE